LKLNPIDPQNYLFYTHLALGHLGAGRQEDAAQNAREAVRLKPDFGESRVLLASALGYLGRKSEAVQALGPLFKKVSDYVDGRRIWAPVVKELVLNGLKKVGLVD
jgi:predicted Zn-dependent protease